MKILANNNLNDLLINGKYIGLPAIMKRMNFVEDLNSFVRRFTIVYVEENNLYIGHTVSKVKTKIEISDLEDWVSYFDRI